MPTNNLDPSANDHLQAPVDPDKKAKRPWQAWLSGSPVLVISILLHVLFAIIATLLIVQRIHEKRKQNFSEITISSSAPAAAAAKHQSQVTDKKNSMSIPDVVHSLTVDTANPITLPAVPMPAESAPSGGGKLEGTALNGEGIGNGARVGEGKDVNLDASVIAASFFGRPDGAVGLQGTFYDLATLADGKPSGLHGTITKDEMLPALEVLANYVHSGWRDDFFNKYYQAPQKVYAGQLMVPYIASVNGPKAFNQPNIKPDVWVVIYQGKFKVPEAGTFRFVGYGDAFLEVEINGEHVFHGSWEDWLDQVKIPSATEVYPYTFHCGQDAGEMGYETAHFMFKTGKWIKLEPDVEYNIKIMIGDNGGTTGFWLMTQQKDKEYPLTSDGKSPILPAFKVSNVPMPPVNLGVPEFDQKTNIGWTVVPPE